MRYADLRRLFVTLVATAVPAPLLVTGCGGAVRDGTDPGEPADVGGGPDTSGTGGYPVFAGSVPYGGGGSGAGGTSEYPVYTGIMYDGGPAVGGYPVYTGTGGAPPYLPAPGGSGPVVDAGPPTQPPYELCGYGGCSQWRCVPLPDGADAAALDCQTLCGESGVNCSFIEWNGHAYAQCPGFLCGGRRPSRFEAAPAMTGGALRTYFQQMARLEAASVPAFRTIARELAVHGAPRSLCRAARRSAREEIRHARQAAALAERFGGVYVPPRVTPHPTRSLEELATDNAVEGCVRETFGALVATWQANAATDPVVRSIMRRIAVDETRHAHLARRIARWTERRLSDAARARVTEARRRAAAEVLREIAVETPAELATIAGLPSKAEALRLASALRDQLWT